MRLIDADAVLYALVGEVHDNATKYGFRIGDIIKLTPTQVDEIVSRMPTIEPERKTGHWIKVDDFYNRISGRCSNCGWESHLYENDVVGMNYCPECGARMESAE